MKSWETLSRSISKIVAHKYLGKIRANSLEIVLRESVNVLDKQTLDEIGDFMKSQQTTTGGFADKSGRSDLYYSLFGFFVAEALGLEEVIPPLKKYVENIVQTKKLTGVHLNCALILYARLFGVEALPPVLTEKFKSERMQADSSLTHYSLFLNLLTFYYTEDYWQLYTAQKGFKKGRTDTDMPCPVTSARLILQGGIGLKSEELKGKLLAFYRNDGSFSAVKGAPIGDLLSTGVALYALKFNQYDFRIMKPDCLAFVDLLYSDGGFCATPLDPEPDVEYTFYGLLALGALAD